MTRQPRDRNLDKAMYRADRAADIVPTIRRHLDEMTAHTPILSAAAGRTGSSGSGPSNPTLAVVLKLEGVDYHRRAIDDAIATINVAFNVLDECCREALGYRGETPVIPEAPRCVREFVVDEANDIKRRCDNEVEYYTREDGTKGWRSSGLCAPCRQADIRKAKTA